MKKFYIITNDSKDQDYEVTERIKDYIVKKGGVCILASEEYGAAGRYRMCNCPWR